MAPRAALHSLRSIGFAIASGERRLAGTPRAMWSFVAHERPYERGLILIGDTERVHTEVLARGLFDLGHTVEIARSCGEAFALACTRDVDALLVSPSLRDGSALVLPSSLGIRRPPVAILVVKMAERLLPAVAEKVGYDAQLTKVVDPHTIDRLVRIARLEASARRAAQAAREERSPA